MQISVAVYSQVIPCSEINLTKPGCRERWSIPLISLALLSQLQLPPDNYRHSLLQVHFKKKKMTRMTIARTQQMTDLLAPTNKLFS